MSNNEERRNSASDAAVAQVDAAERMPAEPRMSIQYTVSRILAEASDFDAAAARILETIGEAFAWKLGALWMIDRNMLYCHTLWHASSTSSTQFEQISRHMHFSSGIGLPGRVWATGEPAWLSDVREDNNFPRIIAAENEDLRAAFAFPIRSGGGTLGVIEFFSVEIRSPDTDLMQAVMTIGNQTGQFMEKKRVEEAMRASEARKAAILQTTLDAIITIDSEGRMIEFNPAAEQMFGYSRDQVIGQELCQFIIPPSLRYRHRMGMAHYLATGEGPVLGKRLELSALRADGTEFPVELAITRIPTEGPPLFTAYLRDITEQKRAEQHRNVRLGVTHALSEASGVDDGASGVLRAVCEPLAWDVGCFWTVNEAGTALACTNSWHRPGVPVDEFETASCSRTFEKEEGLPGRVWASGQPAWILDIAQDGNFPRLASAVNYGLHSAFACPVVAGDNTVGVIEFFTRRIHEPDADLLEMMGTVAGTVGQFIERNAVEDELRRSERELADFFENATVGLHWVGSDGIVLRANQAELDMLVKGTVLIGLLQPSGDPALFQKLADREIIACSMELVPRTTRAQMMDALSSQSTVAGYKAVLLAANALQKFFPMLMTAAGTVRPARVLVIGAGVAGLQAIATARRIGAVVEAFDTRPVVKEQVQSLERPSSSSMFISRMLRMPAATLVS